MMGKVTVFDIAVACLHRHVGGGDLEKFRFIADERKRAALRHECLVGSLALDTVEELFDEARRDGVVGDLELLLEARRRAREPEALDRLRQRLKAMLN